MRRLSSDDVQNLLPVIGRRFARRCLAHRSPPTQAGGYHKLETLEPRLMLSGTPMEGFAPTMPGGAAPSLDAYLLPDDDDQDDDEVVTDASGFSYYLDPVVDDLLMADGDDPAAGPEATSPLSSIPILHSNADADVNIFLDFDGHFEAQWGSYSNASTPVYDIDGDASTFSDTELSRIQGIWDRVAEDFAPFDVDVTTEDPGSFGNGVALRAAIGGSWSDWFGQSAGGVAYLNSFTNSIVNTVYVFEDNLGNGNEKYTAEAVSHELGHGFGLSHQSTYNGSGGREETYNSGSGSWAPIMGVGYYKSVVTWHNGTRWSANTYQDDMSVISNVLNGFGYEDDDHGASPGDATELTLVGNDVTGGGIIETLTDVDAFSFTTGAGNIDIDIDAWHNSGNLDIAAELRNAMGQVILTGGAVGGPLGATISGALAAGTYSLYVSSVGTYGHVGQYSVEGTVVGGPINAEPEANADALSVGEDGSLTFWGSTLLANDTDADLDDLTISGFTQTGNGDLVDNGDGSYTYTPDDDFNGADTFTYTVDDGNDGSDTATVTIDVTPVADTPSLTVADAIGFEGTAIELDVSAALNDAFGSETLSITISGVPLDAVLSAGTELGGGVWSLTGDQLDGLTITINDFSSVVSLDVTATATEGGNGDTASVTESLTVTPNVNPDAVGDDFSMSEDGSVTFWASTLLADDSDADLDTLSITSMSQVGNGSLVDNGDGSYTYTPDDDFKGTDTFTYTVSDGRGGTDTATVSINVGVVADTPTLNVVDLNGFATVGIELNIGALLNDGSGSETLTVTVSGVPAGLALSAGTDQGGGVWTLTADQLDGLTLTTPEGYQSQFDLTVTATATEPSNGDTASVTETITVTVATNDTPVIGSFYADDTMILPGGDLAFRVDDVTDSDPASLSVRYYYDANDNGVLDGADLVVGLSDDGPDFRSDIDSDGLSVGSHTFFAQAEDGAGALSGAVEIDVIVGAVKNAGDGKKKTIVDPFGTGDDNVSVKLKGSGQLETVTFENGGETVRRIVVTGANGKSKLTISGDVDVTDILIDGSIKQIDGRFVTVDGQIDVTGALGSLRFEGVSGTITVGAAGADGKFNLGTVIDLSIVSVAKIKSLKVDSWSDTDATADVIAARSIGKMKVEGDFAAGLDLSGIGRNTLKRLTVGGAITGGHYDINGHAGSITAASIEGDWSAVISGDLKRLTSKGDATGNITARSIKSLKVNGTWQNAVLTLTQAFSGSSKYALKNAQVGGDMQNVDVVSSASLGRVSAMRMIDSTICAGVSDAHAIPDSAGDFAKTASIKSVQIRSEDAGAFDGSVVAAWSVDSAKLNQVATNNGGDTFGVVARSVGKFAREGTKMKKIKTAGDWDTAGDFVLRVV